MDTPVTAGSNHFEPVAIAPGGRAGRRILCVIRGCYLDDSNGAAVASRAILESLAARGFEVEVFCGTALDSPRVGDFLRWLTDRTAGSAPIGGGTWSADARPGIASDVRIAFNGVTITINAGRSPPAGVDGLGPDEDFLNSYAVALSKFRPNVVVGHGGDRVMVDVFARARSSGAATVFLPHDFAHSGPLVLAAVDRVVVASRFSSDFHRRCFGLECETLPYLLDLKRVGRKRSRPDYVTFVNPSIEKGVFAFARIADELGKRRPDIPILVVESRGTEETVAACGLELRDHGNVFFMAHTHDPREFWGVTKVCLLPSVWWENQPLVAVEAMVNGIPVIGSDRGAIPETLGGAGIVLPLPERITQATRMLPTAEEVEPWVRAVIRLWDDAEFYEGHRVQALAEAKRWNPEVLEPQYVKFFRDLKPGTTRPRSIPPGRAKAVALVPYLGSIEPECEDSLRRLEAEGVRVVRSGGNSAIDVARNRLASEALHDGFESVFFIDSDLSFDPLDALRLLARPEPVVAGIYAKKARREFASIFAEGVAEVVFGAHAFGLYPLKYAATGFLRIKAAVLRRLVDELDLPLCNARWGRGEWPFFQPIVVPQEEGREHYLGEDWAFSHRLAEIGVTPMADTSIRLWDHGRYAYGWEDVGADPKRFATYTHRFGG